ncbi:MAG: DUF504 domain-containing protein [Verrucomicrobiota bacterium]|jgi:uncharacterized protein (UPF0248 family)
MIPIHELLNRIRWDPECARGSFQLGYYDRAEDRVILVPFADVRSPADSPNAFQITDAEGSVHRIPFHLCSFHGEWPAVLELLRPAFDGNQLEAKLAA